MTDILPEAQQLVNAEFETSNPALSPKSLSALKTFAILRFVPSHKESEIKNLASYSWKLLFFFNQNCIDNYEFYCVVLSCGMHLYKPFRQWSTAGLCIKRHTFFSHFIKKKFNGTEKSHDLGGSRILFWRNILAESFHSLNTSLSWFFFKPLWSPFSLLVALARLLSKSYSISEVSLWEHSWYSRGLWVLLCSSRSAPSPSHLLCAQWGLKTRLFINVTLTRKSHSS